MSLFPLNAITFVLAVEILKLSFLHIKRNVYNVCWFLRFRHYWLIISKYVDCFEYSGSFRSESAQECNLEVQVEGHVSASHEAIIRPFTGILNCITRKYLVNNSTI
jgi:hypothetical protein